MHHPPFKSGITFPDQVICENGDKFGDIVEQNPQIHAIACGHFHFDVTVRWRGTAAYITPSSSFAYDHKAVDERGIESLRFLLTPPSYRTFTWVEGNRPRQ